MRTNFAHLKGYPEFYETALNVEKVLVERGNQSKRKMVGNAMRQIAEGLMQECVRKYCGNEQSFDKNCKVARSAGIITQSSYKSYTVLRKYGNICSHPGGSISELELVVMYQILYDESYKMIHYYLKEENIKSYKEERENRRHFTGRVSGAPVKPIVCTPIKTDAKPEKKNSFLNTMLTIIIWCLLIAMALSVFHVFP